MKHISFSNDLYFLKFDAYKGSRSELNEERLCRNLSPLSRTTTSAFTMYQGEKYGIFFIQENPGADILAHECLHASMFVLSEIGETNVPTYEHEYLAYLLQWFMKKLTKL